MGDEATKNISEELLRQILAEIGTLSERMTAVEQGQARLEQGQARLESAQANLERRLTVVEEKVDRRQMEIRPIWERVLAEIAETRNEVREVKAYLRDIRRDQRALNDSVLAIKGELRDMDERLAAIEPHPSMIG